MYRRLQHDEHGNIQKQEHIKIICHILLGQKNVEIYVYYTCIPSKRKTLNMKYIKRTKLYRKTSVSKKTLTYCKIIYQTIEK